jgi:hypothetical protein
MRFLRRSIAGSPTANSMGLGSCKCLASMGWMTRSAIPVPNFLKILKKIGWEGLIGLSVSSVDATLSELWARAFLADRRIMIVRTASLVLSLANWGTCFGPLVCRS